MSSTFRRRSRNGQLSDDKRGVGSANLLILLAWIAIATGVARSTGRYYVPSLFLVLLGTMLLVGVVANRATSSLQTSEVIGLGLAVIAVVYAAFRLPAELYSSGLQLDLTRTLTSIAAIALAVFFVALRRIPRLVAYFIIGIMAWAGVAMIVASPSPPIDVWYMLQSAAHGLSHGHSMYNLHWFAPRGEDSNAFVYLPGSAVLLWPFYLVFGDVRYGELAAFLLTAFLLMRARGKATGPVLACLAVLYPAALFGIQQGWVDPLVVLELCVTAFACMRGHRGVAVVAFAAALVTKQQVWLLAPLAAFWDQFGWRRTICAIGAAIAFLLPWYLGDPAGFVRGAVLYNVRLTAPPYSLSLYTAALRHGYHPSLFFTGAATVAAIALALWRGVRDTRGFLIGAAMVEAVFNLTSKISHFNEWELAADIALLAVGFSQMNSATEIEQRHKKTGADPVPNSPSRLQSDRLASSS